MTHGTSSRRFAALLVALAGMSAMAQPYYLGSDYCQILDRLEDPVWHGHIGYMTKERVREPGGDNFGITELGAHSGLAYFRTGFGDLDIRFGLDSLIFMGDGNLDLPDQVSALRLDARYVLRLNDGYAVRLGLEPGLYSDFKDISGDDFFLPFNLAAIRALTPDISVLVGAAFFPEFDRWFDPRIGMRWALSDYMLLDLFYPESRLIVRPNYDWRFLLGFRITEYLEYQLENTDDRRRLMYDDSRLYAGVETTIREGIQFMVQAGRVFDRSVDFKRIGGKSDVDDAFYIRVGIGGVI